MILDDIVACKKKQIEEEKKLIKSYEKDIENIQVRDFKSSLNTEHISIIAEIKKASPSKGVIREDFNPAEIAEVYEKVSVDAISVLTEKNYFMGDDSYIRIAKAAAKMPVLRKDFIIDEYQVLQAKAIGADALLLIERILKNRLNSFHRLVNEIGLSALVEVHDEEGLYNALNSGCEIIGINNRDLRDFSVDLKTTERLMRSIPCYITTVSESGIKDIHDIKFLKSLGVNAVLIGEAFMRNLHNPQIIKNYISQIKRDG